MDERHQLLVVAPTGDVAEALVAQLASEHCLTVVTSFEAAKAHLQKGPHLLITEVKLGEYNGLQLALRVRASDTPAIVIGNDDAVLEREARQLGATYVNGVWSEGRMRALVSRLLDLRTATARSRPPH